METRPSHKLALVVGHYKDLPGTRGVYPLNCTEYEFCNSVAMNAFRYARDLGIHCQIFIRKNKEDHTIYDRVNEYCKDSNAVAIELHFNSCENHKAKGTETLFDNDPADSIDFARYVQDALVILYNRKDSFNRKLKLRIPGDRGYHNLNACKVTSCLIEPFFGDHPDEAAMAYIKTFDLARTLAEVSVKFLNDRANNMELN